MVYEDNETCQISVMEFFRIDNSNRNTKGQRHWPVEIKFTLMDLFRLKQIIYHKDEDNKE